MSKTVEQLNKIRDKICDNLEYLMELIRLIDEIDSGMEENAKLIKLEKQLEEKINK